MSKVIRGLQQRRAALVADARLLLDAARNAGSTDLSAEQQTKYDALREQIAGFDRAIAREQEMEDAEAASGVVVRDDAVISVTQNAAADPKRGFKHFGDFAQSVINAARHNGALDERLTIDAAAPATYGNESSGQDGGFLIPPEYATNIWTLSLSAENLLQYTDSYPVSGNSMVFPKDETTPWGTDGVRAYWQAEASVATPTKPKFGVTSMRLHKLMALVPLTDELISDAQSLSAYLSRKVSDSIRWKTNEAILYGSGAGQPLGALQSNAAVVVAKDSGQAANTVTTLNFAKMISRLPDGSFAKAFWLINNDVLPGLFTLTLGNYPIYIPVGGLKDNPFGMILGRPAIVTQHAKALSAQGDVQLHDLSYYRTISKGGMETAVSMHLYFDADATAFRTTFRMDGQPALVAPIKPANSSNNLSPFLQLQNR